MSKKEATTESPVRVYRSDEDPMSGSHDEKQLVFEVWAVFRNLNPVTKDGRRVWTFERNKQTRKGVRITRRQADILNHGAMSHPDNRHFNIYLEPGEEIPEFHHILDY